jgi:hypothetical protein
MMVNWIQSIVEPKMLYLAWQAPDHLHDRFRWAVGVVSRRNGAMSLRYLRDQEFASFNQGRAMKEAINLGYQGHAAFSLKREVHTEGVEEALMRRMPPRSRPDFTDYKVQFRLPSQIILSDFSLLGSTEAKVPNDGFSLVDPLDPSASMVDLMIEIAGHRYYAKETSLDGKVGSAVEILPEPENPKDPNAVQILLGDKKIGNINRLQCKTFLSWLANRSVTAEIERLNGSVEKPRAFIFVRVSPSKAKAVAAA